MIIDEYYMVKNTQESDEKLVEMSINNEYTIENLLEYSYHQHCYKLNGIDLSRQTKTTIPQKINFTGNQQKIMVRQCLLLPNSNKKLF